MKQNKILTALGFASTAQHSTAQHSTAQHSTSRQLTKRIVQVTAFSLSCLVSLPSFAQCGGGQSVCDDPLYDGEVIAIGYQNPEPDPFDDPFFDPPESDPCEYDCGDGGGSSPDPDPEPGMCPISVRTQLEARKAAIPGCDDWPGHDYDQHFFLRNEVNLMLWVSFATDITPDQATNIFSDAFEILENILQSNFYSMNAAYGPFEDRVWDSCNYLSDTEFFEDCRAIAYNILGGYSQDVDLDDQIFAWFFGWIWPNPIQWSVNWGGRFQTNVTRFYMCQNVYIDFVSSECSGDL